MPSGPMTPVTLPLHDIHLPPAISWWPPAPGWWLLLCVFSLLIVAIYLARQHWQRRHLRRLALSQLEELELQYSEQKTPESCFEASPVYCDKQPKYTFRRATVQGWSARPGWGFSISNSMTVHLPKELANG